jgi:hypothetical protein
MVPVYAAIKFLLSIFGSFLRPFLANAGMRIPESPNIKSSLQPLHCIIRSGIVFKVVKTL